MGPQISSVCVLLAALLAASHLFVALSEPSAGSNELPSEGEDELAEEEARNFQDRLERADLRALALRRPKFGPKPMGAENRHRISALVGLRRVHRRRPEFMDASEAPDAELVWAALARPQKRSKGVEVPAALGHQNQNQAPQTAGHKFFYVLSPVSEQILPLQSERFAQGFRSLLPLAGGNYATGLRKESVGEMSSALVAPLERSQASASESLGCNLVRTVVQLAKDELDPASGQLVRHCTGKAELSSCEGACASSVQPSIKSASGFSKNCACCNEGSFRRVKIRLGECFLPVVGGASAQQDQEQQLVALANAHMDIEVEEPAECQCRQCDNLL